MKLTVYAHRIGNLRFRLPQPIESYEGEIDATGPATQCLQPSIPIRQDLPEEMRRAMIAYFENSVNNVGGDAPQGEDCTSSVMIPPSLGTHA